MSFGGVDRHTHTVPLYDRSTAINWLVAVSYRLSHQIECRNNETNLFTSTFSTQPPTICAENKFHSFVRWMWTGDRHPHKIECNNSVQRSVVLSALIERCTQSYFPHFSTPNVHSINRRFDAMRAGACLWMTNAFGWKILFQCATLNFKLDFFIGQFRSTRQAINSDSCQRLNGVDFV